MKNCYKNLLYFFLLIQFFYLTSLLMKTDSLFHDKIILGDTMKDFLPIWILFINLFCFFLFYIDKKKAIKGKYRISEFALLFCSFLGGSLGSLLSMRLFHHKTKKLKFQILIPLFLILHILFLSYLLTHPYTS